MGCWVTTPILRSVHGDDTLIGGAGNDKLFGGAGTDTAVYSGNQADYLVTALANGVIEVSDQRAGSPDGTDRLESIGKPQICQTSSPTL